MKKMMFIAISTLMFFGCSESSNKKADDPISHQQAQTKTEQTFEIPNHGTVKITCEYDQSSEETCTGTVEATGDPLPADTVHELAQSPMIDNKIEEALKDGCDNKTLVLICELRDDYPLLALPDPGNPNSAKNKEFYQKKHESHAKAVDAFVADNPGLLSDEEIEAFKATEYGFTFNLDACAYTEFIQKNKNKIYILELMGVVDNTSKTECTKDLDYTILFNDNAGLGPQGNHGTYQIFKDAESYKKYIDSKKQYVTWEGFDFDNWSAKLKSLSNKVDFTKDNLVLVDMEVGSGSIHLRVLNACDDQFEVASTWCEGHPMTNDMAYPMMIARMAKGDVQVKISSKGLACSNNGSILPGQLPDQKEDIQELTSPDKPAPAKPACDNEIPFKVLEKINLLGTGDHNWNQQSAHVFKDMKSFEEYLDSLRAAHLGEWTDGKDNSVHYDFDGYPEKYKDFDFNTNILVAFEGGSQPTSGYGMAIESACNNKVEYNVTWCDSPEIAYTADIGYPFILASFAKGEYEFVGGVNSHICD